MPTTMEYLKERRKNIKVNVIKNNMGLFVIEILIEDKKVCVLNAPEAIELIRKIEERL